LYVSFVSEIDDTPLDRRAAAFRRVGRS